MKIKYEVSRIDENCRFYKLNDENGNRLATIEYKAWNYYKYNVCFARYAVEDNLNKEKSFRTLKEAKEYIAEILNNRRNKMKRFILVRRDTKEIVSSKKFDSFDVARIERHRMEIANPDVIIDIVEEVK